MDTNGQTETVPEELLQLLYETTNTISPDIMMPIKDNPLVSYPGEGLINLLKTVGGGTLTR